ncbi:hypothetical protein AZH53_05525 [Methanomicrobiaceae archaeon CYW5]|uniref:TDP-N-acetylfucosamine:lipid II N-acetylfucosaminyltransferase n=1 Tax=Methanovulcanius yangii TaxID=1789227 RepID=UPI0029C9BFDB|nr:TDP-N-acetylfucosamine:lipid II N-acetylfucosaminyltransferase [Methanovulcanius yangii]MBT8507872.1 hypothetical protein [Methanovulcanius yangii]
MKKILHIFSVLGFRPLEGQIDFIRKNYDGNNHHFICLNQSLQSIHDRFSVPDITKGIHLDFVRIKFYNFLQAYKFLEKCNGYDLIIFHSIFIPFSLTFLLSFKNEILKKSVWIVWGGDLYAYREKNKSLTNYMMEVLRKRIIPSFYCIVSNNCDFQLCRKWYHSAAINFQAYYPYLGVQNELSYENKDTKDAIHILLGNSATKSNRHIDALMYLKKFNEENIKIFIPLSYGDQEYGKYVETFAKEIFGDKAIALNDYIDRESYGQILSEIDIGIFNHNRQQAMGTIYSLILSGAKIYANADSCIFEILIKENDLKVYSIDEIENNSFKEFYEFDSSIASENRHKTQVFLSNQNLKFQWDKVFSLPSNNNQLS